MENMLLACVKHKKTSEIPSIQVKARSKHATGENSMGSNGYDQVWYSKSGSQVWVYRIHRIES
eukprot:1960296-Pyramimonas_sp.AAC.2